MAKNTASAIIDQQEWLEPVAAGVQKAVTGAYESAGSGGQAVKNFLHGTWLGHPLHPVLTDVPIGAWTSALFLDAFGLRRAADAAVGLGILGAIPTAVAGLADWSDTAGKSRKVGLMHAVVNTIGLSTYM